MGNTYHTQTENNFYKNKQIRNDICPESQPDTISVYSAETLSQMSVSATEQNSAILTQNNRKKSSQQIFTNSFDQKQHEKINLLYTDHCEQNNSAIYEKQQQQLNSSNISTQEQQTYSKYKNNIQNQRQGRGGSFA